VGNLSHYRRHRNDEHREALVDEALRYCGFHLEGELAISPFWSDASLAQRAGVLLYLLDRGLVYRSARGDRVMFEVVDEAEDWVISQPALSPYLVPTFELIAALRRAQNQGSLAQPHSHPSC
jgi:hypothetical protein